jgi:hypothetical protein
MAVVTNIDVFRGQSLSVDLSPSVPTSVAGWNCRFRVRDSDGTVLVELHTGSGVTIINPDTGAMRAILSAQDTLLFGTEVYKWDFWRVDPGAEDPLAYGNLRVRET